MAADAKLIKKADLAKAREVEFVELFSENVKKLIEALGVTRKIAKQAGTVLKSYKATGTLENGAVAEGDTIPLSQYKTVAVNYGEITLKKWRKATSAEAIVERGYVLATDFANLERKLDGINNGICDSTFALNNTINSNFRTLDGAVCNLGYQALQNTNAIQTQLAQCCCDTRAAIQDNTTQGVMNTNQLARQIESCCCDAEKQAMQTRFDAQAYNCNTLQAIDKLGDRIIDYISADKAQALRDENQALRLAASQVAQNQYIINALRPYPTPSFNVAPLYQFAGCGCNSVCG